MTADAAGLAVLAVLSLVSWAIIVFKALQLWRVRSGADRRAAAIAGWPAPDSATRLAGGTAPADRILTFAMEHMAAGHRGAALTAALGRSRLRRNRFIEVFHDGKR